MRWMCRFAAVAVLGIAAVAASARSAERVIPGQRLFAELGVNDDVTVLVDCIAGTPLTFRATAFKGTTLRLDMALADPDGRAIDLTGFEKVNTKQTQVTIAGYRPSRTGTYRLSVTSINSTQGGFDLTITGAAPKKVSGTGTIAAAGATAVAAFEGRPGDRAVLTVKPAKKSAVAPLIDRFVDAGGAETAIGARKQTAPVTVATLGTSRFEISGADGTTGDFTWTMKIARAVAPKTRRDATEIDAVGTITGTVIIDGQSTRPTALRESRAKPRNRAPDLLPGEVVVSAPGAKSWDDVRRSVESAMPGATCTVLAAHSDSGPYLVGIEHVARWGRTPRAKSATRALAASASASPSLEWVTPNALAYKAEDATDPFYERQFHLQQTGLPRAWHEVTGSPAMVVAVVDTGRMTHPDLIGQQLPGYDFVASPPNSLDGDGWDPDPTDAALDFHGTHVAGIIGARTNNGVGISGVLWETRLLPVRVLGKDGGSYFDIAAGVRWAAGLPVTGVPTNPNPARVINLSLGGSYADPSLAAAIGAAIGAKVIVVAAAGNEGTNTRFYPAAYPDVISVYALDNNYYWASYSNWGDWISVGAPGGDSPRGQPGILSTYIDSTTLKPTYSELSGTSMAAPQVAGICALLALVKPDLNSRDARDILQRTALDLGPPGFDVDFGYGAVDAAEAIEYALTPFAPPNAIDVAPSSLSFDAITNTSLVFVRTKTATAVTMQSIEVIDDGGFGWLSVSADSMTTPATLTATVANSLAAGAYTAKIRLTTSVGVVDVPVKVVRTPRPTLNIVRIAAVDASNRVVAQTSTSASKGWAFTLDDVPLGRHRITALADLDGSLKLDRVDEWEGAWPLLEQPGYLNVTADSLDPLPINLPLERYDGRFEFDGTGAGGISGALGVHVVDARTRAAVPAAGVHVGTGAPLALTDNRGRSVVVGGFSGAQFLTITSPNHHTMSRVGQNAQYAGFALEPLTAASTTSVTVTVTGLAATDRDVWIQVGDARASAVYDGVNAPAFPLVFTTLPVAVPISVVAFDTTGSPTRSALFEMENPPASFSVPVTAVAIGAPQARQVTPTAPAANFTTSGATLRGTTYLRWNDERWLAVGDSPLVFGQSRSAWWPATPVYNPALPMKLELTATDTTGRATSHVFYGTTTDLQPTPNPAITFPAPVALTAPSSGATNLALTPTMTWSVIAGAQLHRITIEEVGGPYRWFIWAGGATTSMQLPLLTTGGLKNATNYRWRVETFRFANSSFDAANFREERLATETTSRTVSAWSTFRTQ